MLKHVLMFRLKEKTDETVKSANLIKLKEALEALKDHIPEIKALITGVNISPSPASYDLFYDSEFEDQAALERYRTHPEHQEVVDLIKEICSDRVVVDYWA